MSSREEVSSKSEEESSSDDDDIHDQETSKETTYQNPFFGIDCHSTSDDETIFGQKEETEKTDVGFSIKTSDQLASEDNDSIKAIDHIGEAMKDDKLIEPGVTNLERNPATSTKSGHFSSMSSSDASTTLSPPHSVSSQSPYKSPVSSTSSIPSVSIPKTCDNDFLQWFRVHKETVGTSEKHAQDTVDSESDKIIPNDSSESSIVNNLEISEIQEENSVQIENIDIEDDPMQSEENEFDENQLSDQESEERAAQTNKRKSAEVSSSSKRKKERAHDEEWINRLLNRHKGTLKKIERNGKILLQCDPCSVYYSTQNKKSKKYHWAEGLEDSRTWERFKDHLISNTHTVAVNRRKVVEKGKIDFKKALEAAANKEKNNFSLKKVEHKLKCLNVIRNLFETCKQRQSTRSLYSRLQCFDQYFLDLEDAAEAKLKDAKSLAETQPTEFRNEQLEKYQKLADAMPILKEFVGEAQQDGFQERSVKIRNMKLQIGEQIYVNILEVTLNGQLHSFSSDGVEDVKTHHSLNLFIQSELETPGQTKNYFGRIEYTQTKMDYIGESNMLLHLLNQCLPGFPGYVFAGVLDDPNVHFGEKHSVSVLLKISLTRDFSHASALAITHETKAIPEILRVKVFLEDVGRDLKNSYQKKMEYRGVFVSLEKEVTEFETCPSTRWIFLRKAGIKLSEVYFELTTFYENRAERHLAGEAPDPAATGRLKTLKDVKFLTCLHVMNDILEPVIALNIRTQGRHRLISEKRHDVQIVERKLEALKKLSGTFEKKLLKGLDFSEEYPKMVFDKGEITMQKLAGHIVRGTRAMGQEFELRDRAALTKFISEFKMKAITRLLNEIRQCLTKDSLANAFGALDILAMPVVMEKEDCWDTEYGEDDMKILGNHFGNEFWVLRSFKDSTSPNGFIVKPCLNDPVLDKDSLSVEFNAARGEISRTYRKAVMRGDTLTKKFEPGEIDYETQEAFTQRRAYEDFVQTRGDEYPNLTVLVRHLLSHIPNSVDPERNASNLKATFTETRNRLEYDTLNSEMQITENGPKSFTESAEQLLNTVADTVLEGGFSSDKFKPALKYMKNVDR